MNIPFRFEKVACLIGLVLTSSVTPLRADEDSERRVAWVKENRFDSDARHLRGVIDGRFDVALTLHLPATDFPTEVEGSYFLFKPAIVIDKRVGLSSTFSDGVLLLSEDSYNDKTQKTDVLPVVRIHNWPSVRESLRRGDSAPRVKGTWMTGGKERYVEFKLQPQPLLDGAKISIRTLSKDFPRSNYRVDVAYPQFQGFEGVPPNRIISLNREIESTVFVSINAFKRFMKQWGTEATDIEPDDPMQQKAYFTGATTVRYSTRRLISLDVIADEYYGGNHNQTTHRPLTCDLTSGKKVELKDLFNSGTDYLQLLASLCKEPLRGDLKGTESLEEATLQEGTLPTKANYDLWNLTPNGLLIIFEKNQVASHLAGEFQVLIPYAQLKRILRPVVYQDVTLK